MFTVVTSFSNDGFNEYGKTFLDGAAKYLSPAVELLAYVEAPCVHPRAHFRLVQDAPGAKAFLTRHADNPMAQGRVVQPSWTEKDQRRAAEAGVVYSMRTDAYKFCRKPFVIRDAARRMGHGTLVWIDADVVWLNPVPLDLHDQVLRGSDVAYLGRRNWSECGFVAMRLPQALPLIEQWAAFYESDAVFSLPEWHDSYVFDVVRLKLQESPQNACEFRSISNAHDAKGHVWCATFLAKYFDHLKGPKRKALGHSPEHPRAR